MLNILLKKPMAVPPYQYPGESNFMCDEILIKLDPYGTDYIRIRMISENEIGVFTAEDDEEECVYSQVIDEP